VTDWTTQAADVIENTVATVRDKTVQPATSVVRAIVFGVLALLLFLPALILSGVLVFRVLFIAFESHPSVPYGIVSALMLLGGAVCMALRKPKGT